MFKVLFALTIVITCSFAKVDPALVQKVQDYLNGLKTYQATIDQTNSNNTTQRGRFYMYRDGIQPFGKMRIEYDRPVKDLMVVDGARSYFYDGQTKETNSSNIDSTPAAFLLRRQINLNGDLKVIDKVEDGNELGLKIIRSGDESGLTLILKFSTDPIFKLNGWAVIDGQGLMTRAHLSDIKIGVNLDSNLFEYQEPK